MTWVFTDYKNLAMAFDNFTMITSRPDGSLYFHVYILISLKGNEKAI